MVGRVRNSPFTICCYSAGQKRVAIMGIFDFFRRRKTLPSTSAAMSKQVQAVPASSTSPYLLRQLDVGLTTPSGDHFDDAFRRVIEEVEVPFELRERLGTELRKSFEAGSPRDEEKAAIQILSSSSWKWYAFERWEQEFRQRGEFPYMWAFMDEDEDPIETLEDAISELTLEELRAVALTAGIMPKPAPRKRSDFLAAITPALTFEMLLPPIDRKKAAARRKHEREITQAKCKLLVHTISMTAYSLRTYYQASLIDGRWVSRRWSVHPVGNDNIENEHANLFNQGKTDRIPPYFPGDRNHLMVEANN